MVFAVDVNVAFEVKSSDISIRSAGEELTDHAVSVGYSDTHDL